MDPSLQQVLVWATTPLSRKDWDVPELHLLLHLQKTDPVGSPVPTGRAGAALTTQCKAALELAKATSKTQETAISLTVASNYKIKQTIKFNPSLFLRRYYFSG